MKIGIDGNCLRKSTAGTGRYARNLISNLEKISHENKFIFFYNQRKSYLDQKKKKNFIPRIIRGLGDILWTQLYLPYKLRSTKADLFFSPSYIAPLFLYCPLVVIIYDVSFKLFPEKSEKFYRYYLNFFLPRIVRRANRIITLSENSKKDIMFFYNIPAEKIEVIHGAVDLLFHRVSDENLKKNIKEKYKIKDGFILNVNVLEPRKNIESLISAFNMVKKKRKISHELVVVGEKGWSYESIFNLVKKLELEKSVIFTGRIPDEDLNLLYNTADIFVFPSLYEGFGLPVMEAMACGCPVIASNKSSIPEVVGDCGILVNPYDIEELADAIWKVINDNNLRQEMKDKSINRANTFKWENSARKVKELFDKVQMQK